MHEMTEPAAASSWDDLFADLGLPTKTSPAPEAAEVEPSPAPGAVEQEPMEKEEAPAPRGRRRRSPTVAAAPEEAPAAAEATEQPAEFAVESLEASVPAEEPALEAGTTESPTVEGGEEATVPRGRSRRRRRGRGSKSAPVAEGTPAASTSEAPADGGEAPVAEAAESIPPGTEGEEESGRRPRRRRSRGRNPEREETPRAIPDANADVSDDAEEEELEPVGREEEVDDLSNWNVPTWGELIGSLYRPER
jgi:ribonuclease E